MRTILSAFVLSTLALAAPMVHADEAKPAAPASEKAPAKKSSSSKTEKKSSAAKAEPASDTKPAAQKSQPRRTRPTKRASSSVKPAVTK